VRAQTPPPVPPPQYFKEFSTHDATTTLLSLSSNLPEAWADVKSTGAMMPGKGWTFCVGTVGVTTTFLVDQPRFSGESIALPPDPANQNGFRIASGATIGQKQIVVLQARGPDLSNPSSQNQDQTIRWQAYFYGDSGLGDSAIGRPATNARAVK